jgi:NIMA (never in mitosis gene a)-related kinase
VLRSWLLQLCLTLYHLHHELSLIHRDIKTINVLVMDNGLIKLSDFGLGKKMNGEEDFAKSTVGTPYYLSPETVNAGRFNIKSDVWGLGCLMYELCTGEKPFKGTAYGEIFNNIVHGVTG